MAGEQLGETKQQLGEEKHCLHFIRLQQAQQKLPEQLQEKVLTTDAENSAKAEENQFYSKFLTSLCFHFLLSPFKTSR